MSIKLFEPLTMINSLLITPSPKRDRGNGPETWPGIKPSGRGDVIPNLLALGEPPLFRAGRRSELFATITTESLAIYCREEDST
jgi:hypothetical protein